KVMLLRIAKRTARRASGHHAERDDYDLATGFSSRGRVSCPNRSLSLADRCAANETRCCALRSRVSVALVDLPVADAGNRHQLYGPHCAEPDVEGDQERLRTDQRAVQ